MKAKCSFVVAFTLALGCSRSERVPQPVTVPAAKPAAEVPFVAKKPVPVKPVEVPVDLQPPFEKNIPVVPGTLAEEEQVAQPPAPPAVAVKSPFVKKAAPPAKTLLTRENYNLIKNGMTYREVVDILGKPDLIEESADGRQVTTLTWKARNRRITIIMRDKGEGSLVDLKDFIGRN